MAVFGSYLNGWYTAHFSVTPDSKWLLYHGVDSGGKHSLHRVSTAGDEPERLGDFATDSSDGGMDVSPDGRKILISAGEHATGTELWYLENFIPSAKK
jgi:Tol biopolymer transport system component